MKKLSFPIHFTGFSILDHLSCFAAIYVYVEGMRGNGEFECVQEKGKGCAVCGNCRSSNLGLQQEWYFAFGSLTGCNSRYESFDGSIKVDGDRDKELEFCMGYSGYKYKKVTDNFKVELIESIDRGYPVLAVMKDRSAGPCRVLIGYDDDTTIMAEPAESQNQNAFAPDYNGIEAMYVITEKGAPKYTFVDGLRNIERSLINTIENVWDDYASYFKYHDYWEKNLKDNPEEIKRRFDRARQMSWNFDHCHNFSQFFIHQIVPELKDSRLDGLCRKIDAAYCDSHNQQWAMIGLFDGRDWSKRIWESEEAGFILLARWLVEHLKQNDEIVLSAIREMIAILNG